MNVLVRNSRIQGRGAFAEYGIKKGDRYECPVFIISENETLLEPYYFPWDTLKKQICICAGWPSFLNHSEIPNIKILSISKRTKTMTFVAICDINSGQELFLRYGNNPKFYETEPANTINS